MKISARNQLSGVVKTVKKGAVNADVIVDIGNGQEIFANITNEAVDELALAPGRRTTALIKASFVLLTPDPHPRVSARNKLSGTISQIIPGAVNDEVKLQLKGARVLTAIVTHEAVQELRLAVGSACIALIKSSHVLLAVDS